MRWVEVSVHAISERMHMLRLLQVLMVNHYKNCEENNGQIWNAELVLRPHLWLDRLHLPAEPRNFHARFMQPGCYELNLRAFVLLLLAPTRPWRTDTVVSRISSKIEEKGAKLEGQD